MNIVTKNNIKKYEKAIYKLMVSWYNIYEDRKERYVTMIAAILMIIFFICIICLIIYLGGRKRYIKVPENKLSDSTNILDISLPTNMYGYYIIAKLHLSKVVHQNASSFGTYSNGMSIRSYNPAYDEVKTKVKEITASTFRELFDKITAYMVEWTVDQVEWVKKRDTTKPSESSFKYVYHAGDDFAELNQRYNLLYTSYLNEIAIDKTNKREDKVSDIKNNFF